DEENPFAIGHGVPTIFHPRGRIAPKSCIKGHELVADTLNFLPRQMSRRVRNLETALTRAMQQMSRRMSKLSQIGVRFVTRKGLRCATVTIPSNQGVDRFLLPKAL